jgi:hypothetical protein
MYLYRDIPVLQNKDDQEADLDTAPFHEDVDSPMNACTAHDENAGRRNNSTADGRVETGGAIGVELDASKARCDGPSGETDTNPILGNGGEPDSPRGETDTDAVIAINGAQRDGQGDNSTETSTKMQVDTSDAAQTPHVETDSMHGTGPAVSASVDDTGGTAQHDTPSWITEAKQYLLSIQAGDKWEKLVSHWMDIEKRLGYPDGSVSCFLNSTALK